MVNENYNPTEDDEQVLSALKEGRDKDDPVGESKQSVDQTKKLDWTKVPQNTQSGIC